MASRWPVALALTAALTGCSSSFYYERENKNAEGRVLDEQGRPVAGVMVAFVWEERVATGWSGGRVCRFARAATTDAYGRYVVPAYWGHYPAYIAPYKQGWHRLESSKSDSELGIDRLGPASGDDAKRIEELKNYLTTIGCNADQDPSMGAVYKAVADELEHLPAGLKRDELHQWAVKNANRLNR